MRSSIQAAVDAASPGDTVVVPPGRYQESVTIGSGNCFADNVFAGSIPPALELLVGCV